MEPATTEFVKAVIAASWQGGLVILLILLVRPVLGVWVPARWRYLLWTLALIRLLVPAFLLPPTPVSFQNVPAVQNPLERAELAIEGTAIRPPISREHISQGPGEGELAGLEPLIVSPTAQSGNRFWKIAALLWAAGAATLGAFVLVATFALHRRLRRDGGSVSDEVARIWEDCCSQLSLRDAPRLVVTRFVESPALLGVFRPLLLIPRRALPTFSRENWEHVFMHELAHYRLRDHWTQALQIVALCAHWFNPLVWIGFRYLRADRELAADEWALRNLREGSAMAYGSTLLKILSPRAATSFRPSLIGIGESAEQLKNRLRRIGAFAPRRAIGTAAGAAVSLILAVVVLGRQLNDADLSAYAGLEPAQIFVMAAANGDLAVMRRMLDEEVDINSKAGLSGEQTALAAAAAANQLEAVRLLLTKGAELKANNAPSPALVAALEHGWPECARYLSSKGATCEASLLAAANGDLAAIERALAAGRDAESLKQLRAIAAVNGRTEVFSRLFDVIRTTHDLEHWELGREVVARTIARGHREVIESMITRLVFVHYPSVMRLAGATAQNQGMREWLAAKGVEVPAYSDGERLIDGVERQNLPEMRRLLDAGVDANFRGESSWTALTRASITGHEAGVKLLLERGADPNTVKHPGSDYTPLCFAKTTRIADMLFAAGAKLDAELYGGTAHQIHYPTSHGPAAVVKWFLDHGVDPTKVKTSDEPTLLFGARSAEIVQMLLEKGVSVTPVDQLQGRTALHHLEYRKDPAKVAEVLLRFVANPNARDKYGTTPLHTAPDGLTIDVLVKAGADLTVKDDAGNSVFVCRRADQRGRIETLRRLGLPSDLKTDGEKLLQCAIMDDQRALAKELLDRGLIPAARFEAGTYPEFSALSAAIMGAKHEIALMLRAAGAKDVGELSEAAARGDIPRMEALLAAGANVNEQAGSGETPLWFAVHR
nr:ankyrin repeat domain-containing protein [Verrucomicrobiota bacterium]